MCYIKIEIHGRGFDCIWQVRFKLAEAQFNTRMTEIPQQLDVFQYNNILCIKNSYTNIPQHKTLYNFKFNLQNDLETQNILII
jgi:hypothetical protein